MGLYDREYGRDDYGQQPGIRLDGPRTLTTNLVLVTVGVYVAQIVVEGLTGMLALPSDWFRRPWECYRLLTYGFLHDTRGMAHILINMAVLWMFGRELEAKYGKREFLWFYLSAIVFAGIGWSICEAFRNEPAGVVGASGGVAAVMALFALNFPHRKVLFMFFIPMPMWVAAVIGMLYDINLSLDRSSGIAGTAHLAGALFGLYYYRFNFSPGRWLADVASGMNNSRRPTLRVHHPESDSAYDDRESEMDARVNEILKKINEQGQDSLTWSERRFMEKASQEYQKRR
ncbi:MAG: rhomboid family intramembrane serine protease [Planctomycetota bacterium]